MDHEHDHNAFDDRGAAETDHRLSPLAEPVVQLARTRHFVAPAQARRFYRLFGDLEYDLLSLSAELAAMQIRLREVRRRISRPWAITPQDERQICTTAHELTEHLYQHAERHHHRTEAARGFRFEPEMERRAALVLADIAEAVLGIADDARRARERAALDAAIDAYAILDLATLLDLHESVQPLVALQRRTTLEADELDEWRTPLVALNGAYPLSHIRDLDSPEWISARVNRLRRRIERMQSRLEHEAMVYLAVVKAARFRS